MYNYTLNLGLEICLKILSTATNEIANIDGRISVEDIESQSSSANLLLTQPGNKISFVKITIEVSEVELENADLSISIIGSLDETEQLDIPFTHISAESIMNEYKQLRPLVREGILHRFGSRDEPERIAKRTLEVKYRMFDKMYEADDDYSYDVDTNEIAKSVLPYIKSLNEIYLQIYSKSRSNFSQ